MLNIIDFDLYSIDFLALIALGVIIPGLIVGYITDTLMHDLGFGPYGNGFLAILGAGTGIYTRYTFFGWLQGQEILIITIFTTATATFMLLLLGLAKHWVQD